MKQCEYCSENLDHAYYHDTVTDDYFCIECKYEHVKSISYIDLWNIFEKTGDVKIKYADEE